MYRCLTPPKKLKNQGVKQRYLLKKKFSAASILGIAKKIYPFLFKYPLIFFRALLISCICSKECHKVIILYFSYSLILFLLFRHAENPPCRQLFHYCTIGMVERH